MNQSSTAMPKIRRESLLPLETYARERNEFRARVIEHKKHRTLQLGDSVTLIFEDELTIRYQIQEMLRVERIFEEQGIQDELETYNPLVPDGRNFKATMMLEYPDPEERQRWLSKLIGIEDKIWIQIRGFGRVGAIADEDLVRESEQKTSSVHFLRFELTDEMAQTLKSGVGLAIGIDHPQYRTVLDVPAAVHDALIKDLA
jgi:hypothetical protein